MRHSTLLRFDEDTGLPAQLSLSATTRWNDTRAEAPRGARAEWPELREGFDEWTRRTALENNRNRLPDDQLNNEYLGRRNWFV